MVMVMVMMMMVMICFPPSAQRACPGPCLTGFAPRFSCLLVLCEGPTGHSSLPTRTPTLRRLCMTPGAGTAKPTATHPGGAHTGPGMHAP